MKYCQQTAPTEPAHIWSFNDWFAVQASLIKPLSLILLSAPPDGFLYSTECVSVCHRGLWSDDCGFSMWRCCGAVGEQRSVGCSNGWPGSVYGRSFMSQCPLIINPWGINESYSFSDWTVYSQAWPKMQASLCFKRSRCCCFACFCECSSVTDLWLQGK